MKTTESYEQLHKRFTKRITQVDPEDKETMIHVYEEEIQVLQNENNQLKAQVEFLKEQLHYKTFGKPTHDDDK